LGLTAGHASTRDQAIPKQFLQPEDETGHLEGY
jgi:hypothetical protein